MDEDDDTPEMVIAKGKARAAILEARSKLHWTAQWTMTVMEGIQGIGCVLFLGLGLLLCLSPLLVFVLPPTGR